MKKGFAALFVLLLITLAGVMSVSATFNTVIAGKIYDSPNFETANGVANATVHVTCNSVIRNATSLSDGTYSVVFSPEEGCFETTASAWAEKDDVVSNIQTGVIQDYTESFDLYLGVINIALIPEFGVVVGMLTLLSAVGIFFFVRRK